MNSQDVLGDLLAAVLLEEVRRALDPHLLARARDQVAEDLARLRVGEDRVGVREGDQRRLLPARQRVGITARISARARRRSSSIGTSSGNCAAPAFDSASGNGAS